MSAQKPRRHFATPFVVTLAAALPACSETPTYPPNPPAPNPPGPTSALPDVASAAPNQEPVAVSSTAAPGQGKPGQGEQGVTWSITQSGDKCLAMSNASGGCPPGATCNPPPPRDYPCPKDAIGYPLIVSRTADSKKCSVTYRQFHRVACPPNVRCNPPPPREVTVDTVCPQ